MRAVVSKPSLPRRTCTTDKLAVNPVRICGYRIPTAGLLCLVATTTLAQDGNSGPRLQQVGARVISISRLTNGEKCHPATVQGRVVRRNFTHNGMMLENVIIETKDGARELINIDEQEIEKALPSSQGVIVQGIQSLLKEGNQVIVRAFYCGAAGRVA